MNTDVIVVGGGASGMVAAIVAARRGLSVLLLDKKEKLGKKILATGNGKCNYSNTYYDESVYRSDTPEVITPILEQFSVKDTISFFRELGVEPKEKNGYLYPASMQAAAIVEVLTMELRRLMVDIHLSESVTKIQKKSHGYMVITDQSSYESKAVILATGGKAGSKLGSDGSGYDLAKSLGHKIVPVTEALVALRSPLKLFKQISGIRINSKVTVVIKEKPLTSEVGELQITDYGISGIPVFQISRYATKALNQGKKVEVLLDLLPDYTREETITLLLKRQLAHPEKTAQEYLIGLFPYKLAFLLVKQAGMKETENVGRIDRHRLNALADLIKNFRVPISCANGFEQAQVCAGGVDASEVSPLTLESIKNKGIYLTGELLDVEGTCGGYNLQWAWSTGYVAGSHCLERN